MRESDSENFASDGAGGARGGAQARRGSGEPTSSGSLARGLKVVEALADAPSPLLLIEIADRVRLDSSTVYRLLQLLCHEGYAVRLGSKRYCAGPRTLRLLDSYHPVNRFCREVEVVLQELRDRIGETILVVLYTGIQRVIVKVVQGREVLSQSYETWLRTPLHGSASGKTLLAYMSPARLREVLGAPPYPKATEFTVTDEESLLRELARVREREIAIARDDAFVGMTAIAAPILWNGRPLGCLSVVGSSNRLAREVEENIGAALRDCTNLIVNAAPTTRGLSHCLGV